ncbi:Hypothetical predicted protein [Paramuricea clavata]|uniref:Uncharacterized protein n=1 Tax=Paramuricea clavata TaxID=317549 RepID=A0A6S7IEX8_PARCT|nr:Hypothetical predicted protein [Paramuricea clavata]
MKMIFPATILISSMLVPLVFSGTINAPKKNCRCRRSDAFYTNGLCLRSLPCKKNQILPSMLRDRQLGNKIVVCNQKVYRAYPVMTKRSRRCPVAGTLYNLKFNVCVRMLKCSEKVFGVPNGSVSRRYYVLNDKIYQSYPSHCQ